MSDQEEAKAGMGGYRMGMGQQVVANVPWMHSSLVGSSSWSRHRPDFPLQFLALDLC